eukprot:TRINITY_DN6602_c0_g3_i1.p1 TRINITY_DN6602_c0_g3~~TRINITY_DN6602_c0_g3_i1.p1  ORF type:complete len:121 (+),score=25.53 TRINITY_DN6602_c0_g3_i1:481-843(+)
MAPRASTPPPHTTSPSPPSAESQPRPGPPPRPPLPSVEPYRLPPINPPESVIPDPVTLADQWRYAQRMYGRYYSYAWGTAILAGAGFYAMGYYIKGGDPLASRKSTAEKQGSEEDKTEKS